MQTSQETSHGPIQPKKARRESADASKRAIEYISNNRGRVLTVGERLDILSLHANLRADTAAVPIKEAVTAKISRLLGRSNKTVGNIWSDFIAHGSIIVADIPANQSERVTRITKSPDLRAAVQVFIQKRCEECIRTTCKDVMHFLVEEQFLHIDMTNSDQVKVALRQVQRFVKVAGYCRGENKTAVLRLSSQNVLKRAEYVQLMTTIETAGRRIVYMDESFIRQHYKRHNDSLYDPSDPSCVKSKHKGRRLCFVAAIIDHDRSVGDSERSAEQQAGLLIETVDVFEGGKQTKDYHGMFNHEYFVKWMKTLLRCLKTRGLSNCLIVMDNAKYHKVLPASTPRMGNKKEVLLAACQQYGIEVPASAVKPILWKHLSKQIAQSVVSVVVEMARAEGHEVVYTPPHHSDLQPIEIVWAIVKGEVGRQYTTNTTFTDIRARLDRAFLNLQPSTVQSCIDAATKQLLALKAHLDVMDAQSEPSDSGGDSDEHKSADSEQD